MNEKEITVSRSRKASTEHYGSIGVTISITAELDEGDRPDEMIDNLYRKLLLKENQLLGVDDE